MAPFTAHAEHPLAPFSRWMLLTFSLCTTIIKRWHIILTEQGDQSCKSFSDNCGALKLSNLQCQIEFGKCQEMMRLQQLTISIMASLFSTIHHKILRCLLTAGVSWGRKQLAAQRIECGKDLPLYLCLLLLMAFFLLSDYTASWLLTAVISFLWNAFLFEPLTKTASLLWSFKKQKKTFLKRYVVSGIAPEGTVSLTQAAEAVLATCQTASTPAVPTGFGENFGIGKPQ